MKKSFPILLFFFAGSIFMITGCKKEKNEPNAGGDYPAKLTEIAAAKFLDEAVKLGFPIHIGDNPPNITGSWKIDPFAFDKNNFSSNGIGHFEYEIKNNPLKEATLNVLSQNGTSVEIEGVNFPYLGWVLSQFVIGSANEFTIVRHYNTSGGDGANFSRPSVLLISGTKDGNTLRNLKLCDMSLPHKAIYETDEDIEGGKMEICFDGNKVSEKQ